MRSRRRELARRGPFAPRLLRAAPPSPAPEGPWGGGGWPGTRDRGAGADSRTRPERGSSSGSAAGCAERGRLPPHRSGQGWGSGQTGTRVELLLWKGRGTSECLRMCRRMPPFGMRLWLGGKVPPVRRGRAWGGGKRENGTSGRKVCWGAGGGTAPPGHPGSTYLPWGMQLVLPGGYRW